MLDASVSYEVLEKVRSLILEEPVVNSVQNLADRNSGRFIFVETAITMRTTDLKNAYAVS